MEALPIRAERRLLGRSALVSFPLEVAAAYFLWHKDTSAYLKGTCAPAEAEETPSV